MGGSSSQPVSITSFDPVRYQGRWWEIARYPNPFQKGCVRSNARYHWNARTKKMKVTNECIDHNDHVKEILGFAIIPNPEYPGRLEVVFPNVPTLPSMSQANYWIHWTDYSRYAIVGNGSRSQLWILSREKTISQADFELLILAVKGLGYDPNRLIVSEGAVEGGAYESHSEQDQYDRHDNSSHDRRGETVRYYEDRTDNSNSSFWPPPDNPSKNRGIYKNKTDYDSDFTGNK